jgi:alanyl-tRNA synthetase
MRILVHTHTTHYSLPTTHYPLPTTHYSHLREPLDVQVIDVGIGLERVSWLVNGSATSYVDAFGCALDFILEKTGVCECVCVKNGEFVYIYMCVCV